MNQPAVATDDEGFEDYQGERGRRLSLSHIDQVINPATIRALIAIVAGTILLIFGIERDHLITTVALVLIVVATVDLIYELRPPIHLRLTRMARLAVSLGIGLLILFSPRTASGLLALALGLLFGLSGLLNLARAWGSRHESIWSWLVAKGAFEVVLGVVMFVATKTLLSLVMLVAAVSWVLAGIFTLVANLRAEPSEQVELRETWEMFLRWLDNRQYRADDRTQLYLKLYFEGPEATRRLARFFSLMAFSTAIATFGVIQDSTAVVIGAMLIAPLMTPLMGTSASLIMGWPNRARRSALVAMGGIGLAIGFSLALGSLVPQLINVATNSQITSRVNPNLLDLMIALAAGGAGAFAMSRPDVSDALPGVAIAISLVPPLTVVGITISVGAYGDALGATLLFGTNAIAILLAGSLVFLITGFTPLRRVVQHRDWIGRVFLTVGILGLAVFGVLAVSSSRLDLDLTSLDQAQQITSDWADQQQDLMIATVNVVGQEVDVAAVGPNQPERVDQLASELAAGLEQDVQLTVRWVPESLFMASGNG